MMKNIQIKYFTEEIPVFIKANDFKIDPKDFYNYYNSSDWKINGQAIKNWKVLLRTWEHKTTSPSSNVKIAGTPDWLEDYKNNFGERESTEVQNRMNMSAKKRSKI